MHAYGRMLRTCYVSIVYASIPEEQTVNPDEAVES